MVISMDLGPDGYDIVLERGALRRAGELLNLRRKVLLVADAGVPAACVDAVAAQCGVCVRHTVEPGEARKSFAELEAILTRMLNAGFTRGDWVVAVGGGMVGDLAGFAASCYMRGVDFYNLPTTVLSQVDSSIGGKTAVNLGGVKNIAGAFYQPKKVLIDADVLQSLPARQVSAGLAEAVKMALIRDAALFERFERGVAAGDFEEVIAASLRIKKGVVEQDEKEHGVRRALNFGHTIGHGIEAATGLYHGECVALGMLPMCSDAVRARLLPVLEALSLPTSVRADAERVYEAMLHDKKADGGMLTVVRVETPGDFILEPVSQESLRVRIALIVQ